MNLLKMLCLLWGLAIPIQAQSHLFTGIMRTSHGLNNSGDVPYYPEETMTVAVPAGSSEVVLTFDKPAGFWIPWGYAPVTVMGPTVLIDDCAPDTNLEHVPDDPDCGRFMVTDLGNGKAEIKASREWLFGVVKILYDIKVRYETCQSTRGTVDTFFPDRQNWRCPTWIDSNAGAQTPHLAVSPPWNVLIMTVQLSYLQSRGGTFDFLSDTEWIRWMGCGNRMPRIDTDDNPHTIEWVPDETCPREEQYGELERMYEWVEAAIGKQESEEEEGECSCEE